jgi:F0F1-type ATP synthase membrane subunit a
MYIFYIYTMYAATIKGLGEFVKHVTVVLYIMIVCVCTCVCVCVCLYIYIYTATIKGLGEFVKHGTVAHEAHFALPVIDEDTWFKV